jgi:AraC-like DNA-binding protein/mannose-6-phosphate isomerase-like protein (cupin superfamily)
MDINEVLAAIPHHNEMLPQAYPRFDDIVSRISKLDGVNFYPDGLRHFDDLIAVICMITTEASSILSVLLHIMLNHKSGWSQVYFDDGFLTHLHKNNFIELLYVAEGELHKQIEGENYVFTKGEIVLINKGITHAEYLYRKNSLIMSLEISNAFFDKTTNHFDLADKKAVNFWRQFVLTGGRKYRFVCFDCGEGESGIPLLFDQILSELQNPRPGCNHLVTGYVERLLCLLPVKYQFSVEKGSRTDSQKTGFNEILFFLEEHCVDVNAETLVKNFGHDIYYFNRLIKRHTGMTYSHFVQEKRLEKAMILLKTTIFPVEEIARRAGYENVRYFYKIFTDKYHKKPGDVRKEERTGN